MTISAYSATAGLNTTINGINIAEGCPPGNVNDAIRNVMADIATAGVVGRAGGTMTGPLTASNVFAGGTGSTLFVGGSDGATGLFVDGGGSTISLRTAFVTRLTIQPGGGILSAGSITGPNFYLTSTQGSIGLQGSSRIECYGPGGTFPNTMRLTGGAGGLVTIDGSGNLTAAGTVTQFSDRRLKADIAPLLGSLATIEAMQGVRFTRIADDTRQIGLIAQDVETVRPEYVVTGEGGMKSIAYANIIADLIEAVKTLTAACRAHGVPV